MADIWGGLAIPADSAQTMANASPWDGYATPVIPPAQSSQETTTDKVLGFLPHQAGILSKNVVKGATFLPTLFANIPAATANAMRGVGDWALGIPQSSPDVAYVNPYSEGSDTVFGKNAQPNNAVERIEGDTISALSGTGTGVKLGQEALQAGSKFIPTGLANFLSYKPAIQAQAAAGGAVSGSGAKELGFGPKMQTAISLAGGLLTPLTIAGAKGVYGALQPFTESGKNTIVNNTIAKYASDPQAAITALQNSPDYVPGFVPTGGTSSGDTGLVGLERTLQQQPESDFASRAVQNNAAINKYFSGLSGTPSDIAAAESARDSATRPLYQQTEGQRIPLTAISPVFDNIDNQIAARYGETSDAGRKLANLSETIKAPFSTAENSALNINGTSSPSEAELSHIATIYRQERDKANLPFTSANSYIPEVKSAVSPANAILGRALEDYSPEFKAAQNKFSEMSVPINQMQNMQEIGRKITGGTTDAAGNYFFSPAKIGNLIKDPYVKTDYKGWVPLNEAVSPSQYEGLQNINNEMQRANLVNTPAATRVGSNTFNNLASTNALSSATGGRVVGQIPVVNSFYNHANDQIKQKLIQAILTREGTLNALQAGKIYNPTDTLTKALLKNGGLAAYMSQAGNAINGYNP